MVATVAEKPSLAEFIREVRQRANAQFASPQYQRVLSMPLTVERARVYSLQKGHWQINRRDCWGFSLALGPMDVKKLIWEHEEDELAGNKERGIEDHYSLAVRQAGLLDLTRDDFLKEPVREGTRTCLYAWLNLAKNGPWLKSVAASIALEVGNSSEWVDGGGMSYRMGKRFEKELGIPFDKQVNAKEHAEVDVLHAHMLGQIAERHATTPQTIELMMEGLTESWEIDRVWKGQLAEMMEAT